MKILKMGLILLGALLLFITSDLIYFYRNEPYHFARIYLYFSLKESKKSNFDQALANLNSAKQFHLKQNSIIYKLTNTQHSYPYNNSKISSKTRQQIVQFLNKNLPQALKKNSTPFLSNLYYNLALIAYENKSIPFAVYLADTAVKLDPDLGHLYLELADMLFLHDKKEEALKILQECTKFVYPKKQCEDYLSTNVESQSYLTPGYFKKDIFDLQASYF